MKHLTLVACISKDGGLGRENELLWHIPEDMKFFRETTTGGVVVMGRKTFASIGRALPRRENIVLSHHEVTADGAIWAEDLPALERILEKLDGNVYIIGGAALYKMFIDQADRLLLTEVDAVRPADVFFPEFRREDYTAKVLQQGEYDGVKWQTVEYTRKPGTEEEYEQHA